MAIAVHTDGPSAVPLVGSITFNEVFRLILVQRYQGVIVCMSSFHFGREVAGGSAATLVGDFAANVVPTWRTNVTQYMYFHEVYAQRIKPTMDAISSASIALTGAINATPLPSPCAGVITWRTQFLGRSRRGRTYIPGLAHQAAGEVGNGYQFGATTTGRMTNIANAIFNRYTLGANPGAFQLLVWSPTIGNAGDGSNWRDGTAYCNRYTVQNYICTMGSRRYGRGM